MAQKHDLGAGTRPARREGRQGAGARRRSRPRRTSSWESGGRNGNHGPNIRRLEAIGRYGEWERNIELQGARYVSLGTDSKIEFNKAVAFIRSVLPESPNNGIRKSEILELCKGFGGDIKSTTLDNALGWLVTQGRAGMRQEVHERGQPKVYWNAARS